MIALRPYLRAILMTALFASPAVSVQAQYSATTNLSGAGDRNPEYPRIGLLTRALHTPGPLPLPATSRFGFTPDRYGLSAVPYEDEAGSVAGSVLGGVLGMAAGISGAILVDRIFGNDEESGGSCLIIFQPVGVALGAHLGNGSSGRLGLDIGASYGSLLLGTLAINVLTGGEGMSPLWVFGVLGLQVAATVSVERGAARRNRTIRNSSGGVVRAVSPGR